MGGGGGERPGGSDAARVLGDGVARLAEKVGEEAVETVVAATAEDGARLASEAADLLYHLLVLLEAKRLPLERVLEELDRRAGAREARWRSDTSTRTANTPSSTAPTAFPICWTTSRHSAWTRWPSPIPATSTGPGSSTRRRRPATSGRSSGSRRTSPSGAAGGASG